MKPHPHRPLIGIRPELSGQIHFNGNFVWSIRDECQFMSCVTLPFWSHARVVVLEKDPHPPSPGRLHALHPRTTNDQTILNSFSLTFAFLPTHNMGEPESPWVHIEIVKITFWVFFFYRKLGLSFKFAQKTRIAIAHAMHAFIQVIQSPMLFCVLDSNLQNSWCCLFGLSGTHM